MKILENHKVVASKYTVEHKKEEYMRVVYVDGDIRWSPVSYDGECDGEELERAFQKLINHRTILRYCRGPAPSYIS